MIPFNKPVYLEKSIEYVQAAAKNQKISGDGEFTKKCSRWFESNMHAANALLTTSGTHALEMAAYLCELQAGDEVIMPSFTFSSTAAAFVKTGAKIVFVDIRPDTMNLDEEMLEQAITTKTRVIVPVHYAGVACEMDVITAIAKKHKLKIVEDAAQGVMSTYKGKALGTLSDFGCYSFHETKNYTMGEGGAVLIKSNDDFEKAEIMREKGTNRSKFFRGQVDKYSWIDWGSSYLPSDMNAAYLWAQLEVAGAINKDRLQSWNQYYEMLLPLAKAGHIELPHIPVDCQHNAHMFYIKTENLAVRSRLIEHLKKNSILSVYHYVPLHSAKAGVKYGCFSGEDVFTTKESERLLRLPMFYGLNKDEIAHIVKMVSLFYC